MSIERFRNLPDVEFVNRDIETILAKMIADYEQAYFDANGERKVLAKGDPVRIWIYSQALKYYAALQLIDYTGKQNLLKYASGPRLENIGARVGVTRLQADFAIATQRFVLSATRPSATPIPKGTRVSPGANVFFATKAYAEIPAGQTYVDIIVECTETGAFANGYLPGQINVLVDPLPYIASVENIDTSQSGADIESDDSLRERIFLRPDSFSTAGPKGAYIYHVLAYSQSIIDVEAYSPSEGVVDVRFLLAGGTVPDQAMIDEVLAHLSDDKKRPLTDHVLVDAPEQVNYNIELTYYIKSADVSQAPSIQAKVIAAINDYQLWQKSKIGRDINPDELITRIRQAGGKRTVVTAPEFTALTNIQVANDVTLTVTYGGLEDE